jgi:hypothetical protein
MGMYREYKPNPNQLVSMEGVIADRTLEQFDQLVVFQFVCSTRGLENVQVMIDRKHLRDPKLSKPMGYVSFSEKAKTIEICKRAAIAAVVQSIVLKYGVNLEPGDMIVEEAIHQAFKSLIDLIEPDVISLSKLYLGKIKKKVYELRGEKLAN